MKKFVALFLVIVMALTTFCACESREEKMQALSGTWLMIQDESPAQARLLLENIDLYEEEIAVADLNSLDYAWVYEFDAEGNYRQTEDVEHNKACVRSFYAGVFDALYENRETFADSYEVDIVNMTQEEMEQFYADMYGYDTFAALMDRFVENAYDYDSRQDLQNGTYTIDDDMIVTDLGTIVYEIQGDALILRYSDGVEFYTRIK